MTIKQALKTPAVRRALNGLVGCPAGGWGETEQAVNRIVEALPIFPMVRTWKVSDLINEALVLDHADRYQWKET